MRVRKTVSLSMVLLSLVASSCGGGSANPTASPTWKFSGVYGGYVPNIVFHPAHSCEVWASADDMGGLYQSIDCGAHWNRVATPKNFSTYSLTFDPNNSSKLFAPSHFGWGMLKSANGGTSWSLAQAGLPSSGTAKHVYQIAIKPSDSALILAATENGLYKSTDAGVSFTNLNLAWATTTGFRSVIHVSGRLFAGAADGTVKYSDNDGTSWFDVLPVNVIAISRLVASANAIYYLFADGSLWRSSLDMNSPNWTLLNNSSTGIASGAVSPTLAVASGGSVASDVVYLGTSRNAAAGSTRWGLFKSINGGANWTQLTSNVADHSIFSIAIDPGNAQRVLVGSSDSAGIFSTTDGGTTWTSTSSGMQSNVGFGFAQNPMNANELVMSSTVGFGLGKTWHSTNLGSSWSVVSEVAPEDGVLSFNYDPANPGTVLAGMISTGLYRSTTGVTGAWSRVINTDVKIGRIYRDKTNPSIVYALAMQGTVSTDIRIYYSSNAGGSFTQRTLFYANDLAPHPSALNEAAMASMNDAYASTDGFATAHALGLSAEATAQNGLTAVAFNPSSPTEVWVGGNSGGLFRTTNYNSGGTGVTWSPVNTPVSNAMVRQILIRNENAVKTIYVSSFAGDVNFTPGAVLGLWKSTDNGSTWTELSSNLSPCTSFWGFYPVVNSATDLWAGLWGGGGLHRLTY